MFANQARDKEPTKRRKGPPLLFEHEVVDVSGFGVAG